jgi:hypothetical protein
MCTPAIILVPFLCPLLTSKSTAVVCYYPQDMRAMTSLNLASNLINAKGAKGAKGMRLKGKGAMRPYSRGEGFGKGKGKGGKGLDQGKSEGIIAIASAIKDMRALTKIDLSRNNIPCWN